jgi:hypothetical protein
MTTLAKEIGETTHCSVLQKKAERVGLNSVGDFVSLAVARGCRHYAPAFPPAQKDPGFGVISNEDLVALLLLGANEFEPIAIRCAAQLTSRCNVEQLANVAKRERIGRALYYIASAGLVHDRTNNPFWEHLVSLLGEQRSIADGVMPHWSRFVSQTGVTRSGDGSVQWLHCQ